MSELSEDAVIIEKLVKELLDNQSRELIYIIHRLFLLTDRAIQICCIIKASIALKCDPAPRPSLSSNFLLVLSMAKACVVRRALY